MKKSLTKSEPTPTSLIEQAVPTFVPDVAAPAAPAPEPITDAPAPELPAPKLAVNPEAKLAAAVLARKANDEVGILAAKVKLIAENEAKAELRAPEPTQADVAVERTVVPFGRPVQKSSAAECTVYRAPSDGNTVETMINVIKDLLVVLQNISISTAKPADDLRASADAAVRKYTKYLRK
jgi:hypothetical protein